MRECPYGAVHRRSGTEWPALAVRCRRLCRRAARCAPARVPDFYGATRDRDRPTDAMTTPSARNAAPEGVVVLGMHRSGTSTVTRLVSLLGLAVCRPDDLLAGFPGNPRGHWESKSLIAFNNRLLRDMGGSWFCPPAPGSEDVPGLLERYGARGLAVLRSAYPQQPFVWKDPRTCLLLPFWSRVLGGRVAFVIVARHPGEVSDSLERRNGFTATYGLALWERYMRLAILGAADQPAMLCSYDEVLAEPVAWCERLADFLRSLGMELPSLEQAPISAFVASSLRGAHRSWLELEPEHLFPPERVALARVTARAGTHAAYRPPSLPAESPATEAILGEIRRSIAREPRAKAKLAAVPARFVGPVRSTRPKRASPVSVILANEAASSQAAIRILAGILPAGSEIMATAAERLHADGLAAGGIVLRDVGRIRGGGARSAGAGSEALSLAADAAAGRVILVSTGELPHGEAWLSQIESALSRAGAGGVAAAIRLDGDSRRRYVGTGLVDSDLSRRLVPGRTAQPLVPAPLLCGGLCAFDRRILSAAGGIDAYFETDSAALSELSLRLWRMCFPSYAIPQLEVRAQPRALCGTDERYDRLRLATLHLDEARLRAFIERAERWPSYDAVSAQLAATDVTSRRALIDGVCALPTERYFDEFPLRPGGMRSRLRRAQRAKRGGVGPGLMLRLTALRLTRRLRREHGVEGARSEGRRRARWSRR